MRVGLEPVRAQHGADHLEEAAQDPVLVEARDRVDRLDDLAVELARIVILARRVEAALEQLDERRRDLGMPGERLLHVRVAERDPRLAEVLGDRAEHDDLAGREPGGEHELVEAVVLDLAAPRARERLLERLAHIFGLEVLALVAPEAEVVDPHRRVVAPVDLVRPLVGDGDAHVLEQRQHVGEEQRPAGAQELEREVVLRRGVRQVEAEAEVAGGIEPLDALDVEHRLVRGEVLLVGERERVGVAVRQHARLLLAELLDQRGAQVVGPFAGRVGHLRLDPRDVVHRHVGGVDVDHVVQAREHRFGHARPVVDGLAVQLAFEDLLDPLAVARVEPVARDVDETREEAPEVVAADEQPHAAALAQLEDAHRDREQVVLGDLQQLVARVRLDDVDERLVVVAAVRQPGAFEHAPRLAPDHRDLPGRRAVGRVRVEAEEAPFGDDVAACVEALDADVVEVRGAMHGRPRVRLRQVEQVLVPGHPPHVRRQAREAGRDRRPAALAQDAEPGAGDGAQHLLPVLVRDLVLAEAEEGEVLAHPLEQVDRLRQLLGIDRRRMIRQVLGNLARLLEHRGPVGDSGVDVAEHAYEVVAQLGQGLRVGLLVELDVDRRLADAALVDDLLEVAVLVAPHAHDRADHQVDAVAVAGDLHRDRIDEERHVVVHELGDGVRRLPAVLLDVRVVDA